MSARFRVVTIVGTRPECLKMASVIRLAEASPDIDLHVVSSGQHPQMVARTLAHLELPCHAALDPVPPGSLHSRTIQFLRQQLRRHLDAQQPAAVVVQGDTSTAYAGALASSDCALLLAHLEAGLRTSTPMRPFPEEMFRRRITPLAHLHFAPTEVAAGQLLAEGVPLRDVHVVGNSIIDLLRETCERREDSGVAWRRVAQRLLVLTMHRRENYRQGLVNVCKALLDLLAQEQDLAVVCPVHPNPAVGQRIRQWLAGHPRILLTEPLPYRQFIALLREASLIVTDSGGIQEEAPYLGVPVLVTRAETERPECLQGGVVRLVGNGQQTLLLQSREALAAPTPAACAFAADAPFGAGRTAEQVLDLLRARLRQSGPAA